MLTAARSPFRVRGALDGRPIIRTAVVLHHDRVEVAVSGFPPPSRTPFVGRDSELATLAAHLAGAGPGAGRVGLGAGEPGIGKTRLLAELAELARTQGWRVLWGRAYDSDGLPPYLPFLEALRAYVRAVPLDTL